MMTRLLFVVHFQLFCNPVFDSLIQKHLWHPVAVLFGNLIAIVTKTKHLKRPSGFIDGEQRRTRGRGFVGFTKHGDIHHQQHILRTNPWTTRLTTHMTRSTTNPTIRTLIHHGKTTTLLKPQITLCTLLTTITTIPIPTSIKNM